MEFTLKVYYIAQIGLEVQGSADFLPQSPDYLGLQGYDTPVTCEFNLYVYQGNKELCDFNVAM